MSRTLLLRMMENPLLPSAISFNRNEFSKIQLLCGVTVVSGTPPVEGLVITHLMSKVSNCKLELLFLEFKFSVLHEYHLALSLLSSIDFKIEYFNITSIIIAIITW